jgi:hypothetical protein
MGLDPSPDLLERYRAHTTLVPICLGGRYLFSDGGATPFVEFAPSLTWSRWELDNQYLNVLSFTRLLIGFQASAGLSIPTGKRIALEPGITWYWTERLRSEELDALGRWDYPGLRAVAVQFCVAALL